MTGKRRRGEQRKRWEDNNEEWKRKYFANLARAAEIKARWKGIVVSR